MDAAMEQTVSFQGKVLFWSSPDNTNKLCHRCGKLGCAPNFCPLKQTRGRSRTRDPVAKLKERFNVNQPHRSNSNAANTRSRSRSRSKSKDRSTYDSGRDKNISHDRTNNDKNHNKPNPNHSQPLSPDDANNILNLLRELQCEVANFHKRISALELADQRMTRIESHLGLDPLPSPNESDLDLMQEDAPVSHVPLNIQPSAKSPLPPRSILTRPLPPTILAPNTSLPPSHLSQTLLLLPLSPPRKKKLTISKIVESLLKTKIEEISTFFSLKHISFGGIVDTHLHPKQMKFLSKRLSNYTVFSSNLDTSKQILSSGGVSLFIENSLASHVQDFQSHSSRLLSVDLYFKGNVKLRIFVIYIPPPAESVLRTDTIDLLIQQLTLTKQASFYHAVCGDFNMHIDKYYPIYFNQPQIASKHIHRLFFHLLSHGYEDYTPINLSNSLGTFHRNDQITRVDYVWSCPLLKGYALTACIFNAQDICTSDHNPVITYYDMSLLYASTKLARARQLKRQTRRVFKFDSVTDIQWTEFADKTDALCDVSPSTFSSWHINQMCEYLQLRILKAANATLPSSIVGNNYTPKVPKDLEILIQHYQFLNRLMHSILFTFIPILPSSLSLCRQDNFKSLLDDLSNISKSLRGFHLLQEKEFQDSSIRAHLDDRNNNFETDLSSFIDSALSRTHRRITLDRVFIDHPTRPQLLTDPKDVDDAVVNHFQNFVFIKSTPPVAINTLPDRWSSAYQPMDDVSSSIYDSLMNPPTLDEWLSTVSSTPNGKASGPSMITYEMLKHLGTRTSALLLILIQACLSNADIPDLWRQAMVFPIPKPHEWKCQLKNTRPITLLEVIRKSLVKLFYNRLSTIMASHDVLKGGNLAGLPGGSCRDPIITLESIIHDADINKNPLWFLSQDISKAFDSVDLTMLRFALERIRLPASAVKFILSLFMKRTNRVFTAHGSMPAYRVRIGIDQGEVISPLLWVIYIDPLLTVLKNEMIDPYVLSTSSLIDSPNSSPDLKINNLVFMDDSTLIFSSKAGMEFMLSITEEFYHINNTSANHNKYVLITNSLPLTSNSALSPITFNLDLSSLNSVPSITITPIPMTTSFRFLGVWFNIKCSRDFVKKQLKRECCLFAATIRPAKLSSKQVVYLHNAVLIPKLEYRMQVTHLSESDCHLITRSIRSVVKHKANFSRSLPNPILFLSQALGLINLFAHQRQCHITNLFLMANSSSSFIQSLFIYRLSLIQYNFLIPNSPLLIKDWSIWSSLFSFKKDYIACTIALLSSTPFRTHLISWKAYYDNLVGRRGPGRIPYWYQDIQHATTIPDSNNRLLDQFNFTPTIDSSFYDLTPCLSSPSTTKNWIVTLDDYGSPIFGKQLLVQVSRGTCSIVHWISPDCESSPGDLIRLSPCPGCAAHIPLPPSKKRNADLTLCTPKADIEDGVRLYYSRLDFDFDPPSADTVVAPATPVTIKSSAAAVFANSPLVISSDSRYIFFTDGSLINLGTPDVSMGWSWMQIVPDAGFPNSIATYAHGLIRDNPSSSRAEAAAIYAVLTISPRDSEVTIYTDSQTAIDGLRSCFSSIYSNSHLYYKTTNFELWAIIERTILSKNLTVLPVKVKAHSGNYLNDFADSLANTAHTASSSILISGMDLASAHDFVLIYDNDVVCESNPRHLLKQYYQTQLIRDLLNSTRFHFISLLSTNTDYIVDWELTWFTLNFKPSHDASFTPKHASRHLTFKFKLFLDDLPTLEKLKRTRPDLYMDELTCRSCINRMEDLMHLFMCRKRRLPMQQILQSYQNHLISKLLEASKLADIDPTPFIAKLTSFSCWSFSSTNWSSFAFIRGCLPKLFIDLFVDLSIPRTSAIKVIAAIHNNFVQKFRRRIWNPRSYEKSRWENAMNITYKLKTTPKPSNLPLSTYIPYSSLPPPTLHVSRDSGIDWLKNSMKYGWSVDFYSGRAIRYFVSIVASTLVGIYQGGRSGEI
ncbi:ribonuclease HI, putative [Rhizophagus irregularis DAOM 181602=DAOM 197198]|nr:ribonuclease HI, putative [Rhizophagus irregularis DAOM 181602=DAOM 197198]